MLPLNLGRCIFGIVVARALQTASHPIHGEINPQQWADSPNQFSGVDRDRMELSKDVKREDEMIGLSSQPI